MAPSVLVILGTILVTVCGLQIGTPSLFLHMNSNGSDEGWILTNYRFVIIIAMVVKSIWIMWNLNIMMMHIENGETRFKQYLQV